jgi:tRNA (guanine37-N1)-methyltransferase
MWVGVVSLFPELFGPVTSLGVLGRAIRTGGLIIEFFNPRDFATDRHHTVDDRPYGGGPGMVMQVGPLLAAIEAAQAAWQARSAPDSAPARAPVVYLSPQGEVFDQSRARGMADLPCVILVAGRYEGVDERAIALAVDAELSIGDYVLTGGELAALVIVDAVARLRPGVVGDGESVVGESFVRGLLDFPHYTRPAEFRSHAVPPVLLSGHHQEIARWRKREAVRRTLARRPELLAESSLDDEERAALRELTHTETKGASR